MRIDGTHNVDPRGLPEGSTPVSQTPRSKGSQGAGSAPDDQVILESPGPYVRQALAGEDVNLQAIEEAKKLLASGQLDTPQAILRAAEAIIERGI